MILKADVTGVSADDNETFRGYVRTGAIAPHSDEEAGLSAVRESWVILRAGATAQMAISVRGDFGKELGASSVSGAASGTETFVIRKWDHPQEADMQFVQLEVGDASAAATQWAVHYVESLTIEEGEA